MTTRSVIVDDSSSRINYAGSSWFPDKGSQDQAGTWGTPFRSTLHGTQSSASLSFDFSGTTVEIFGASGPNDPEWECFIDHMSIGAKSSFTSGNQQNNWILCDQHNLVDGPHTLTVNTTVTGTQTSWFDHVSYVPSPDASLENEAIYVESSDTNFKYGPGWNPLSDTVLMTNQKDATVTFKFTGISIAWYSTIDRGQNTNSTTAAYSLDDGPLQPFDLRGHSEMSNDTLLNQKLFETTTVPMGRHKLTVVHRGNPETTPLSLDYLVIQNGTTTTAANNSASSSGTSLPNGSSHRKPNIAAIVGGVVSAVAVLIFLIIITIFLLHRRARNKDQPQPEDRTLVHAFPHRHLHQPSRKSLAALGLPQESQEVTQLPGKVARASGIAQNPVIRHNSDTNADIILPTAAIETSSFQFPDPNQEAESSQGRRLVMDDLRGSTRVIQFQDNGVQIQDTLSQDHGSLPPAYTVN